MILTYCRLYCDCYRCFGGCCKHQNFVPLKSAVGILVMNIMRVVKITVLWDMQWIQLCSDISTNLPDYTVAYPTERCIKMRTLIVNLCRKYTSYMAEFWSVSSAGTYINIRCRQDSWTIQKQQIVAEYRPSAR